MEIQNKRIEWFLKSSLFNALLALICCFFAYRRIRLLMNAFSPFELGHLIFNIVLAALFLTRTRASVVTMNPAHWIVALITSFSGFFFVKGNASPSQACVLASQALIFCATVLEGAAVVTLGRSFGFLPALRQVRTGFIYKIIRHPMYLGCILVRLTYCVRNALLSNFILFALIVFLYAIRTKQEEEILSNNGVYVGYMRQVKYRLIPGLF